MRALRIFVSSVQKEFAEERAALRDYLRGDPLMRRLFVPFLFEDVPANPLLAEPLYLAKYIERMGTGTGDMIRGCREAGLPELEFSISDGFITTIRRATGQVSGQVGVQVTGEVTGEVTGVVTGGVTGEVVKLLIVCRGAMTRKALQETLALKGEDNFRKLYLVPALEAGYVEMTIPGKPQSRLQKYRLTEKGLSLLAALQRERGNQ